MVKKLKLPKRQFHAFVWQEGNAWVSQCQEIDIASCGETEHEAAKNLVEALQLHLMPPLVEIELTYEVQ